MNAAEYLEEWRKALVAVGRVTYNRARGRQSSFVDVLDYEIMLSIADAERAAMDLMYGPWQAYDVMSTGVITESMLRKASGLFEDDE